MYLFLQNFKTITTARRKVTMKRIACTIERREMRISINIEGRDEVRLTKTIDTWGAGRV